MNCFKIIDKNRPFILFIHGFMGNHQDFMGAIQSLKNRYSILAIDLPGHGDSKDDLNYKNIQEVAAALQVEIKKYTSTLEWVYAYSMGGRVWLEVLKDIDIEVKHHYLASPSFGLENLDEKEKRAKADEALAQKLFDLDDASEFLEGWYSLELFNGIKDLSSYKKMIERRKKNDWKALSKALQIMSVAQQEFLIPNLHNGTYLFGENDSKYATIAQQASPYMKIEAIKNRSHNLHMELDISDVLKLR